VELAIIPLVENTQPNNSEFAVMTPVDAAATIQEQRQRD
jgi:hypothetical protein